MYHHAYLTTLLMAHACCCYYIHYMGIYLLDNTTPNRFIPLIGDILIGIWKVNLRNAGLLEEFLRIRGEESLKSGGQAMTV